MTKLLADPAQVDEAGVKIQNIIGLPILNSKHNWLYFVQFYISSFKSLSHYFNSKWRIEIKEMAVKTVVGSHFRLK